MAHERHVPNRYVSPYISVVNPYGHTHKHSLRQNPTSARRACTITRYTHAHQVPHAEHMKWRNSKRWRRAVLRLSVHESASEINRSGGDAQVVSCHRHLVVFHLFVEQLTVSIHLDLFWRLLSSESSTSISMPSSLATCHRVMHYRWHTERHVPRGT